MAKIYGTANPAAGFNPGRVPWVDVTYSRSGATVTETYKIGSDPGSGSVGTFTGTLTVNGVGYAVSGHVSGGSAVFKTVTVSRNSAAAYTINVGLTGSIPGTSAWRSTTLSGSVSVPAGGTAPGAPSGVSITRGSTFTIGFSKGSGATSTQINWSKNLATWYAGASTTGSSFTSGLDADCWWRFELFSTNAVGSSGKTGHYSIYTTPKTPTTPTVGAAKEVTWTLPSRYKNGVQLQYSDDAGATVNTVELGAVTTWTDPASAVPPTRQYRVRVWAGPSLDQERTYSVWTAWSAAAFSGTYSPPRITDLRVRRCDSAGQLTELGRYVRVNCTGSTSKVPGTDGVETNRMTRKVRWRAVGTQTWAETTVANNLPAGAWNNVAVTVGDNALAETGAWEVQYSVVDSYTSVPVTQTVIVPSSQVAFSVGPSGIGAGKAWQRGALDIDGDIYLNGDEYLVVAGVAYRKSGVITAIPQAPAFTAYGSTYARNVTVTLPYTPPPGCRFRFWSAASTGFTSVEAGTNGVPGTVRVIQVGSNDVTALTAIGWELVKEA